MAPDAQPEVDVLARDGRPSLLSVPRPVRRLLLSLLVLGVVAGWLVDQRLRDREETGLATCSAATLSSVGAARGRVSSMGDYIRPTLSGTLPDGVRQDLFAMVSDVATGWDRRLDAAGDSCRDVQVLGLHDDLRDRQASCELLVQQTLDYLDRVGRDGREAFRSSPENARSAQSCAG